MPKRKPTKADCSGCYNDFYNYSNPMGGDKPPVCWNLADAELVKRKIIHVDDVPPWKRQPIRTVPNCWRGQRYRAIDPKQVQ